jgi:hypothetical protein
MIFGFKCTPVGHLRTLSIKIYATDKSIQKSHKNN